MKGHVIDTNTFIVADGGAEQADLACVDAAIAALRDVQQQGCVLIDHSDLIVAEYLQHYGQAHPQGAGSLFVRWVLQNQWTKERCVRVEITPLPGEARGFAEFPSDPDLERFDGSDRKFVATALASKRDPEILNATDTDWWEFRDALARNGVRLRFLCPHLME